MSESKEISPLGKYQRVWLALTMWTFPVWWLGLYFSFLILCSKIANYFDRSFVSMVNIEIVQNTFFVISALLVSSLPIVSKWFRKRVIIIFLVWIAIGFYSGIVTPNIFSQISWNACGRPIRSSLAFAEAVRSGTCYPNRLNAELSTEASEALSELNEKALYSDKCDASMCRLLILNPYQSPICYRVEREASGSKALYLKKFVPDPQHRAITRQLPFEKKIVLSLTTVKRIEELLDDEREYYLNSRYSEFKYTPNQQQELLEFWIDGKYKLLQSSVRPEHSESKLRILFDRLLERS